MSSRLTAALGPRRPTRSSVEFAIRGGAAAALAIWTADLAGLGEPYWAGISAVVATAGTLGASVATAVSRVGATIVGLVVGLAVFSLPVAGTLLSGIAVAIALLALPALSLEAGARLGAATTVIITAVPGTDAVSDALARGANIPLGCAIAVGLGFVLFPKRAAKQLPAGLRTDVQRAGTLARSALLAYTGAAPAADLAAEAQALAGASSGRQGVLRDAAREPGAHGAGLLELQRQTTAAGKVVEDVIALVAPVEEAAGDRAQGLVRAELEDVARAFESAARAFGSPDDSFAAAVAALGRSVAALDGGFADVRARRATVDFPTDELVRLLSIMRLVHGAASTLASLSGGPSEPSGRGVH